MLLHDELWLGHRAQIAVHGDGKVGIGVVDGHEIVVFADGDVHVHFLAQLALQRGMVFFAGLNFAAGEFKFIAHIVIFSFITLHAEDFALVLDDGSNNFIMLQFARSLLLYIIHRFGEYVVEKNFQDAII